MNNGTAQHESPTERQALSSPQIIMLSKDEPDHDLIFPLALRRIRECCKTIDSDADPDMLGRNLVIDFVNEEHVYAIIVAVKSGELVGHVLATIDHYYKIKIVNVLQFHIDEGMPQEILQIGFGMLEKWGHLHMAEEFRALVPDEANARRLRMFYKFSPYRQLMTRRI